MIHHGNQQVKEDDYVYHRERSKHEETRETGELFDSSQLKIVKVNQTENGPE